MSNFEDYVQRVVWILSSSEYDSNGERAEDLARMFEEVTGDVRLGLILFVLAYRDGSCALDSGGFSRGPYVVAGKFPPSLEVSCAAKNFLGNIYSALNNGSLEGAAEVVDLYTDNGVCIECRVAIFFNIITNVRTYINVQRKRVEEFFLAG